MVITKNLSKEKFLWLVLGIVGVFYLMQSLFVPIFFGVSVACAAWGLSNRMVDRLKFNRRFTLLSVPIFALGMISGILVFAGVRISIFIQYLQSELSGQKINEKLDALESNLQFSRAASALNEIGLTTEKLRSTLLNFLEGITILDPLKALASSLPSLAVGLLIFVLTFFYVYFYQDKILELARHQTLVSRWKTDQIGRAFSDYSYMTYVSAGLTAVIQGLIIMLGGLFSGVAQSATWALAATFFAFVPYVGTMPISLMMLLSLYFMKGSGLSLLIMLAFAVVASFSDNIVRPLLMKAEGNLHPWFGIIGIIGGLQIWGVAGIFIGPVMMGLSISLLQMYLEMDSTIAIAAIETGQGSNIIAGKI